jgi:hypothetical protein
MVTSVTETVMKRNACTFVEMYQNMNFLDRFSLTTHNMKLHKNPSSGSQAASCTHTDRHMDKT